MPATSTKCTTKPHGDDDDEEMVEEDEGSSCNSILPIDLSKCQKLLCILCTHKAIDPTCLTSSTGIAKYGSTWPWSRYTYVKIEGIRVARKPSTKVCGPCRNTFHLLGLDADYESPQEFLTQSSRPENAGMMRGFIGSQKIWIKKHNSAEDDGGECTRMKSCKELQQVFTSLSSEQVEGEKMKGPRYQFVSKDVWDETLDGKWDQSKSTTTFFKGKPVEGMWVLRGRIGVWDYNEEESRQTRQSSIEDDGTGPFAKERLARKVNAIRAGQQQAAKEREQKSNIMQGSDMLAMLQSLPGLQPCSAEAHAGSAAENEASSNADEHDESSAQSSDSDSGEPSSKKRLGSLFLGRASKAGAKAKSSVASTPATPKHKPSAKSGGSTSKASAATAAASRTSAFAMPLATFSMKPAAAAIKQEPLLFDGRTMRIKSSLESSVESLKAEIMTIAFTEDLSTMGDKGKKTALQDCRPC